jgi:DNA-directed RNA polymerase subunit RPC12/RpoP
MPTPGVRCPHCGCRHVLRSHRRTMEKPFLRFFHLIPYRCDVCGRRFYRRDQGANRKSLDSVSSLGPGAQNAAGSEDGVVAQEQLR